MSLIAKLRNIAVIRCRPSSMNYTTHRPPHDEDTEENLPKERLALHGEEGWRGSAQLM